MAGRKRHDRPRGGKPSDQLEALFAEDDGYQPYVPLKNRRTDAGARIAELQQQRQPQRQPKGVDAFAAVAAVTGKSFQGTPAAAAAAGAGAAGAGAAAGGGGAAAADRFADMLVPKHQQQTTLLQQAQLHLLQHGEMGEAERQRREEEEMTRQVQQSMKGTALMSKHEAQTGARHTARLQTDWSPPGFVARRTDRALKRLRKMHGIIVQGLNVPSPIMSFAGMKLPVPLVQHLTGKGITSPKPIQAQGLPVALTGRDMVGVATTGSGKTLAFAVPMLMAALQEELRQPLQAEEGPVGLILCPGRELAIQSYEVVAELAEAMRAGGMPEIRPMLAIGGQSKRDQLSVMRRGCHVCVATCGRFNDYLRTKAVNLELCRYVVLDEGDQMLSTGRDEEVGNIFAYFKRQRQTLVFSATMPPKVTDFAKQNLVEPVVVNVSRAGAASLDVIQEVEYVKEDSKLLYLLDCLQKTPPKVMVFCENKRGCDQIHEYLLVKGVAAAAIHGGLEQSERSEAMQQFKGTGKDVLVATDAAARGMDFQGVQHVINYDMPKEIETYVHRIGRTGRAGKTGVATTFINKAVDDILLLDLKHLLLEAKQRVPPVLMAIEDPNDLQERGADGKLVTCPHCGGSHSILRCLKLERDRKAKASQFKDDIGGDY